MFYQVQRKILLVEDELIIAISQKQNLENYGYEVILVNDGNEAIETAKKSPIDLILMDINLGKGIDGTQAAETILTFKDIPIVFLSSHVDKEIVKKTERITSYGYVVKNTGITVLDASIKMAFRLYEAKQKVKENSEALSASNEELQQTLEEYETTNMELIKSQKMIAESEERYRELFDNMKSGVAVYQAVDGGKDFVFKNFNKAAESIDNINKVDLINKSVCDIFPGVKDFGLFSVFQRVWKSGNPEKHPISQYQDDRIIGWRDNYVYKLPSQEIVAIYEDVTQQKQYEIQLQESNKKLLQTLKQEKILLNELKHRIKNSFSMIVSMIFLMENKSKSSSVKSALSEINSRVKVISEMYSILNTTNSFHEVKLDEYVQNIVSILSYTLEKKVSIKSAFDSIVTSVKTAISVGLIINELITNAIKYAFINMESGTIFISMQKSDTNTIIEIRDNGVGLPEGFENSKSDSLGMSLVHALVDQVNGKFTIESVNGTRCIIEFPNHI